MIAIEIILDAFSDCNITNLIPKGQKFTHICFLSNDIRTLSSDYLYLCSVDEAIAVREIRSDCFFLCPDAGNRKVPQNTAMVHGISSLIEIARRAQDRMIYVIDWIQEMKELTSVKAPYQAYLDLAEFKLNNSLYVLDAAMVLIASTKNIADDDPHNTKLRSFGYHSEDFISSLKSLGRFSRINKNYGTIFYEAGKPNRYPVYSRWLWDNGMPALNIVMVCSKTSPGDSQSALFEILVEGIEERFLALVEEQTYQNSHFAELFKDVLFNGLTDLKSINERIRHADVPIAGSFVISTIVLRDNNSYPVARLAKRISEVLPEAKIIIEKFRLILLLSIPVNDTEKINAILNQTNNRIRNILNECNAICGISEIYNSFVDSATAFEQSVYALEVGSTLSSYKDQWTELVCPPELYERLDSRFFYFRDYYINIVYYEIMQSKKAILAKTPLNKSIIDLIYDDRKHRSNNAKILYTYLYFERNASKTGAALHMHRNNIIYRISRIEKILNVHLEDFWTRNRILNAFLSTETTASFDALLDVKDD